MSISDRDKKILLVFIGILVFGLVYFFPIRGYMDDTEKLKAENISLNPRLTDLQEKAARETEIKNETADLRSKTTKAIAKFPSLLRTENEIMAIVKFEKELKIEVPSITVKAPVEVQTAVSADSVPETAPAENGETASVEATDDTVVATAAGIASKYTLYDMSTNIDYKGGYKSMKKLLKKIAKSSDKKSINTVSLSFDEKTGNLDGNIVYDSYFLLGSDRPYEEIITKTIKHGKKNIFGTVDASAKDGKKKKRKK